MENKVIDYYKILQCDRNASFEELKRSYQRLALTSHPDKKTSNNCDKFLNIQKAWSVLRDPDSRKHYDALLTCEEHRDLLLYDTIKISDMDYDSSNSFYSFQCRCGGNYMAHSSELVSPKIVIGCDECSFSILINIPSR